MTKQSYFISDAHLGGRAFSNDKERELKLIRFLDSIKDEASDIYFLGDIFDFWYEYKYVVPKGNVRLLGKMAELADMGINIHFFIGNHDIWTFGYIQEEIGAKVYTTPQIIDINGKKFYMTHGDMVGYRPLPVRVMQGIFHSRLAQILFSSLHPWFGMKFGLTWSKYNRLNKHQEDPQYMGEDKEYLVRFAKETLKTQAIDYFIFGHRHIMLDLKLSKCSRVIYLGDWVQNFSYGVFDGSDFRLEIFEE
ncbi:MAG: UDP-2,3-diacylglucosamine diphosphatase [Bacteroidia bacterium]|nr:UDP-2,3-diacylglucosamine diphosphatase [Bacteroidia bacterium]